MRRLVSALIIWLIGRTRFGPQRVVTHDDKTLLFYRYAPFWLDEYWNGREMVRRLPWWRPFNILLHRWVGEHRQAMHDHPRWSITICLRGSVIEHTPWGSRLLRPGSIVFRSHRYIVDVVHRRPPTPPAKRLRCPPIRAAAQGIGD